MKKLNVCILFGGMSPEHEVSLRSAESVLNNINKEKYNVYPVGISKDGDWTLFKGADFSMLPAGTWQSFEGNRRCAISPVRGQGLLCFEGDCVVRETIDVVFPVMHGENCEDGAMQGLLKLAGIPYVGPHVSASAVAMDKTLTKLVMDNAGIPQAAWQLVRASELKHRLDQIVENLESRFIYPMFVKPAGTGSSVGVSKAADRNALEQALLNAGNRVFSVLFGVVVLVAVGGFALQLISHIVGSQPVEIAVPHIGDVGIGVVAAFRQHDHFTRGHALVGQHIISGFGGVEVGEVALCREGDEDIFIQLEFANLRFTHKGGLGSGDPFPLSFLIGKTSLTSITILIILN